MSQRSSTSVNTTASSRRSAGSVRKSPPNSGQFLPSISSTTRTASKISRQPGKNKPPSPNSRFSASHQGERLTSSYSASPKSQYTSTQPIPLTHSQLVALLESVCIVQPRAQEIAKSLLENGVDTVGAMQHIRQEHLFLMGLSIGEQAKLLQIVAMHEGTTKRTTSSSQLGELKKHLPEQGLLFVTAEFYFKEPYTCVAMLNDVIPGKLIGEGAFGRVFKGIWQGTTPVAMKTMLSDGLNNEILIEANMLTELVHPNILAVYGVTLVGKSLYLVMELADGNVWSLLQKEKLSVDTCVEIVADATAGMHYLSSNNVVHRDLACRNLLYNRLGEKYIVKVADFGLARVLSTEDNEQKLRLPVPWMAPECLLSKQFSTASDVWSMGVVLWELLSGGREPSYGVIDTIELGNKLLQGTRLPSLSDIPDQLSSIMLQTWNSTPTERPSFRSLHKKFSQYYKRSKVFLTQKIVTYGEGISGTPNSDSSTSSSSESSGENSVASIHPTENAPLETIYYINAEDKVTLVNEPVWSNFCSNNGARLLQGRVLSTPLWQWINGAQTQYLYKLLLDRIRTAKGSVSFPFRCDTPDATRTMKMYMTWLPEDFVQFRSVIIRVEPRATRQYILDSTCKKAEEAPKVPLCSFCKKAHVRDHIWLELEAAVAQGVFNNNLPPLIEELVCPSCFHLIANVSPTPKDNL